MAEDALPSLQPQTGLEPARKPLRSLPVPTTFGGVAALALGPGRWLGAWQAGVALLTSVVIAWAFHTTWIRSIRHAAENLPEQAEIADGRLLWPAEAASILDHGPFLSIVVDPLGQHRSALSADVTVSIEREQVAVRSLLGWARVAYPADLRVKLHRIDVNGELAAWISPVLIGIALAVFVGLWASWGILSVFYGAILWALAAATRRAPSFRIARRLAAGALLLPAVLMTAAIALYPTRETGLPGLLLAFPMHIVAGWIYCLGAFTRLPWTTPNPFFDPEPGVSSGSGKAPSSNPFERS